MDYILGIFCGVVFVILLQIIFYREEAKRRVYNYENDKYDERLILARGYAYKWGYISTMLALAVNCCIIDTVGWWCTIDIICFGSILTGVMVFATISIFKDAFFSVYDAYGCRIMLYLICGIINVIVTVRRYIKDNGMLDSAGRFDNINLICAVFMIYIAIMLLIKKSISKEDGDEYEES